MARGGGTFILNGSSALLVVNSGSGVSDGSASVMIPPFSARWVQPPGDPIELLDSAKPSRFVVHLTLHRNTPVGVPASEVPAASDLGVELVARSPGAVEGATQGQLPVSPSAPAGPLKLIATFPGFTVLPDEALSWRIVLETQVQRPTPGVAPSPASTAAAAAAAASPFFSLHTVTPPEQDLPSPGTLAAALGAERVLRHLQSRSANAFQALGVTSDPARLPDEDVPAAAEAALRAIGVASPILRAASGERSVAAVVPVVVAGMLRECAEWLVGEGAAVGTAEARVVRRAAAAAEARSPATPGGWFGGIFRRGATAAASTPGGSSSSGGVAGSPGVPATPDPLAPVDTAASAAAASEHLLPPYLDPAGGGSDTERLVPDPTGAAPAPPSDAAAGGESPERGESSEDRLVRLRATADVLQSCLLTLVEATDVLMGRSLAASLESHAAVLVDDDSRAMHRREMSFDLGPTHAAFWGTLTANPWRLVTAAAGSAVVVAGVGVLLATPVAAVAPAVLALHYAAGASAAGAGITAAGHVLSRASVAAHRIDVRGLLRRVAVSASVSVAIGALAGPASAAVYGALGSTLATGAVASGLISTAPLLTTEALEGRWAAIAATGGGHGAALAAALKDVFTVASVGVVTGGVMGTLAQAVATSHGLLAEGGRWGVALATVARAQRVAQAPQRRAARRSGIAPRAGTTPLAVTLAALDAAAAAEPGGGVGGGAPSDDGRAAAASQAREGFALVSATPHVTLVNLSASTVRLVIVPLWPVWVGASVSVFRLGVSDSRVQAIVAGQVAPLPSLGGGGRPPDRFVAFPQVVSVALGGGWSNMRVTCDAGGGGSAPCALLPPPRSAARSYVVKAAGLAGLRVTEASDALHTRLTDSEMVCEAVGWTGSGGRNFTLAAHDRAAAASPVAAAAVAPGVQQLLEGGSEGAPRLLLHNAATAVVARLVVAMTLPRASAGGARERVTVSVRAGTPLALPDSATDIFVTVDVWRPALGEAWVSVCATDPATGRWAPLSVPEAYFLPSPASLDLRLSGALLAERVSIAEEEGPGDGAALAAAAGVLFDDAPREEDAAALPAAVRAAVLEWAAGVRSSARPTSAAWHDGVAAELRSRAEGWRHALVLAERERHGPAASAHRLRSMRSSLRALALAELRAELWDATSLEDAEADAAAAAALERWSAAPTPADGDLGLEPGLWEGRPAREGEAQGKVGYAVNAAAAVAALGPLAGDGGGCTVPEDRLAAIRAASRAWGANGVPPPGMDALLPLLLWALARVHTPPAAPLRLASHVAFVMRFLDAEAYSAGGEEMWCASLLEMGLRAALAVAGWAPRRWRYHRSSPGWIDVPQTPADESSRVDDSE